ncbi:hypothetical protein E1288_37490 [Saccharopolyspora elongata]|uniref:Uncharacterized protein n=1 Tax=Saccharopolyspora elongata TaxID=2530387 RepID=A0A4R4Y5U5_9PSEU|nr:hypothetical protein E1288_37490 [Saccharopolyspora elongata]
MRPPLPLPLGDGESRVPGILLVRTDSDDDVWEDVLWRMGELPGAPRWRRGQVGDAAAGLPTDRVGSACRDEPDELLPGGRGRPATTDLSACHAAGRGGTPGSPAGTQSTGYAGTPGSPAGMPAVGSVGAGTPSGVQSTGGTPGSPAGTQSTGYAGTPGSPAGTPEVDRVGTVGAGTPSGVQVMGRVGAGRSVAPPARAAADVVTRPATARPASVSDCAIRIAFI